MFRRPNTRLRSCYYDAKRLICRISILMRLYLTKLLKHSAYDSLSVVRDCDISRIYNNRSLKVYGEIESLVAMLIASA